MIYLGLKAKHADAIIAIATADRKHGSTWVEPFVGGGNVICRVPPEQGPRIGNDLNWRMIAMLDAIGNKGWIPPDDITEEKYNAIKTNPDAYAPELVAFAATACAFGSVWFTTYARNEESKGGNETIYAQRGRATAIREAPGLRGVKFLSLRYDELNPHIPPESIIYCDPPYAGTTGYAGAKTDIEVGQDLTLNIWNRSKFWKWADALVDTGHIVYVSEYKGPPPSIYNGMTPELQAKSMKLLEQGKAIDANPKAYTKDDRNVLRAKIEIVNRLIKAERERLAARWEVLWSKEVVSDFDSNRSDGGKIEVEKLFHRRP